MNARGCALDNIISILENREPLHIVLSKSLKNIGDEQDRAFTARLTRGVVERCLTLDSIINAKTETKVNRQKQVIRNILRLGVYQVLFMDGVTDFAACDEAVKLAGKRGFRSLGGFVNGVLRAVCRDEKLRNTVEGWKKTDLKCEPKDAPSRLMFKYSMPEWISSDWTERYGMQAAEASFRYFFEESGLAVRCNTSKLPAEALEKSLNNAGLETRKSVLSERALKIKGGVSPDSIPEFVEGLMVVQDSSSVFVGEIVKNVQDFLEKTDKAGSSRVLDLCAAPGGKSLNMADMGFEVTACDLTEQKTSLIREAVDRCGFSKVQVMENDATVFKSGFEAAFDIVLCDLPCSGLGIIGKKPDIKYNMNPQKQEELVMLQREILKNAVRYVRKGGILCYSTCTVNIHENEEQADYIEHELGMTPVPIEEFCRKRGLLHCSKNRVQLLPGEVESDGFFIAAFVNR